MIHRMFMRRAIVALLAASWVAPAKADDTASMLQNLQQQVQVLHQKMVEKDQQIHQLQQKVQTLENPEKAAASREARQDALDAALADIEADQARRAPAAGGAIASVPLGGGSTFKLIDISLDTLFAIGSSTERDQSLQNLQGGAHDPRKRGFTLQQVELSMIGAIDPYLTGEAHIIYAVDPLEGETIVELEEAFATTTSLPWGLQVEVGFFFTEFGRINPVHPHAWDWLDQPVINTRVFGGDGMRQAGVRLGWLTPLPWFSEAHFGVQNANGETMASFIANEEVFEERAIGGRPFTEPEVRSLEDLVYLARWVNAWDLNEQWSLALGGSALYGPNATGGDGETWVYGADLLVKWVPRQNQRGWPFLLWQSEFIRRDYDAAAAVHVGPDGADGTLDDVLLPSDTLGDWGFYTQLLYGFTPGWAAGLRYEYATASGDSVDETGAFVSHNDDPFRDDRHRISPLIIWQPSHFSRVRLQYNYDQAAHLNHEAHSVWFGVEFLFGAHPAHNY